MQQAPLRPSTSLFFWLFFFVGLGSCASDRAQCLGEQPAVNRSHVELQIASHDWLTHKLVSTLADIICAEVLGYSVVWVYPASSQTWGQDIAAGQYDLDLEQWHVDPASEVYTDYVVNQGYVLDAGLLGYSGRSGLYLFRRMLERTKLADYYKFYQNSSDVVGLGLRTFRDSELPAFLDESFPVCDLDWCGSGALRGYWAPLACREAPDDCIEIFKATPSGDEGYFEQLVNNHGLLAIFGYYGDGLEAHLLSMGSEDVMFYWWEPTLLHAHLDVVRVSFPDHVQGCDSVYTGDPETGTITCDAAEIELRKITSMRLRDSAPHAYLALSLISMNQSTIEDMLLLYDSSTKVQDSDAAVFGTACAYAQVVRDTLPSCLTDPVTVQLPFVTKIETFNPETLSCENSTVLEERPATTCYEMPPPLVNRSEHVIRLSRRSHLSHHLVSIVAEIVLRDYLGYTVVNTFHMNQVSGMDMAPDLISGLIEVEMENWHDELFQPYYASGQLHFAGRNGYQGRVGVYVTAEAVQKNKMADYYKFYQNKTEAAQSGFMRLSESPLHQFLSDDVRQPCVNGSGVNGWCGTGDLQGYWVTPACAESPWSCLEVALQFPGWGNVIIEQASANLGLEVVFAYYGSLLWQAVPHVQSELGRFVPFYAFEPDWPLLRYEAKRISFPDVHLGCVGRNTYRPDGPVQCDIPPNPLHKTTSLRVAAMPEARFALEAIQFSLAEMNGMLARHVNAGGPLNEEEVACEFVQNHAALVRTWAPDCMSRPFPPEEVRVNDTVFSQQEGKCVQITCEPAQILTYSAAFNAFGCEECREGEIPDSSQRSCRFCDPGEQPDEAGVLCTPCVPGTSASASRVGFCSSCPPGWFSTGGVAACELCPAGFSSKEAASSCVACPPGTFSGSGAGNCTECEAGQYAAAPSSTECVLCEIGTYAAASGSSQCAECGKTSASAEHFATMVKLDFQAQTQYNYVLGSDSGDHCGCDRGMRVSEGECVPCTEGMQCPGLGDVIILSGYYSKAAPDVSVFKCHGDSGRCTGGVPGETCARGRRGLACAECEENKKVSGSECVPCGDRDFVPFVLFNLIAVAILVVVDVFAADGGVAKNKSLSSVFCIIALGQLVTALQVMSLVSLLSLEWEEPFKTILQMATVMAFNFELLQVGCIRTLTPIENYVSKLVMFAAGLGLLCVIHVVKLGILRYWGISVRKKYWSLVAAVFAVLMLFYIPVASAILRPLQCNQHPNGVWTVWTYRSVVCWESSEHTVMLVISIISFLLVPLGFLAFVIAILLQVKSRIQRVDAEFVHTFSFLFFRFKPGMHWSAVALMLKNLMLAVCIVIPDALLQIIFLVSVNQAGWALVLRLQPWRMLQAQVLDVSLTHVMLMVIVTASFYVEDDEKDFQALSWISSVMVVAVFGAASISMLYNLLRRIVRQKKRFEFFLCHHKSGSGAYTRLLQMSLLENSKTAGDVFIDSDHLDNLDHLFFYVRTETETFLVVASSEIFSRPWCVGEMTTARHAKVSSLLVALPGCCLPDADFINKLADVGLSDADVLTEAGIDTKMICKTFSWIQSIPRLTMQEQLTGDKMQEMANTLRSESAKQAKGANKRGRLVNSSPRNFGLLGAVITRESTSPRTVYFVYDTANIDACAACYVLQKMIIPLSGYDTELVPCVSDTVDFLRVEMDTAIIMCTNGIFENFACARMFAHSHVCRHVSYPVLAEPTFRFPPPDVHAWFCQTFSSTLEAQEIQDASSCITLLFKEIATAFQPNTASLSVLKVSAGEVFQRVKKMKLRSGRSAAHASALQNADSSPTGKLSNTAEHEDEEENIGKCTLPVGLAMPIKSFPFGAGGPKVNGDSAETNVGDEGDDDADELESWVSRI